jgi:glycosyltransferase involved in cell wall biosynthesis
LSLRRTLESLRAQDVQPWEVVLSDDSSEDMASEVASLANEFHCRYIRGPSRGLYANRNHVARACLGTHIRTMDDDHEFPPGHFRHCMRAIQTDPRAIWIIGEFLPGQEQPTPPPCPAQLHPRGHSVTPPNPDDCWALADGASIFPRKVFDRGNYYAEFFVFGASYLEFGSRLNWIGYRIRFLQSTYVLHHFDASTRSYDDEAVDLGSRIFAALCHSFSYQRTLRNQTLTVLQIVKELLARREMGSQAVRRSLNSYREHRLTLPTQTAALHRTSQ